MRSARLLLNITSLGFSDIGFSPCASRTWPEMKGEKHVKGYGIIKKQTWTLTNKMHISCSIKQFIVLQQHKTHHDNSILHIWHLPIRSWETTFYPLPSAPGPGEKGVPGRHQHPLFPSLGRRRGRRLQGQSEFHISTKSVIWQSASPILIPKGSYQQSTELKLISQVS